MSDDIRQLLPHEEITSCIHVHPLSHDQIARRAPILARGKFSPSRLYEIRQGDVPPYAHELVSLTNAMGAKQFLPVMQNYFGDHYRIRILSAVELNGSTDDEVFSLMSSLGKIADELQSNRNASSILSQINDMRVVLDQLQAEVKGK